MTDGRADGRGAGRRAPGRLRRALTAGDRPFVALFLVLVVLVAGAALGPLQMFTEAADRVDDLEAQRDELREEVDALEERERRLQEPDEVELLARGELGLVRPGEDPIVVVPDEEVEAEAERRVEEAEEDDEDDLPWWRRLGRALGDAVADE